jgi:hypothetical protein
MSPETIIFVPIVSFFGIVGAVVSVAIITGCVVVYKIVKEVMKNEMD